jgi:two-component sensor histidine kinase
VPLSLIVTEAVSNAIKYAFPGGRRGRIAVHLVADTDTAHLVIEDDGIGIPAGQGESESGPRDGLGIQLIRGFARQLGATLTVREGNGTRYEVDIPLHPDGAERDEKVDEVNAAA